MHRLLTGLILKFLDYFGYFKKLKYNHESFHNKCLGPIPIIKFAFLANSALLFYYYFLN